jgi:hypothetical protein
LGIGLIITHTLTVNDAKVYIDGRTEEKLERVIEAPGKGIAGQIMPSLESLQQRMGMYITSLTLFWEEARLGDRVSGKVSLHSRQ